MNALTGTTSSPRFATRLFPPIASPIGISSEALRCSSSASRWPPVFCCFCITGREPTRPLRACNIMTQVRFGWLIRSIHAWSANLMIFTAFAHMFSVLFLKAYRKPRELTWVSGVLLLFLVMGFGFSGYLLPWNTLAFFATQVGTEIARQVPIVGKPLMIFLRWRGRGDGRYPHPLLWVPCGCSAYGGDSAAFAPPPAGSTSRHQYPAETGSAMGQKPVGKAGNEIPSQLLAAGNYGLVRSLGRSGCAGSGLPLEPRGSRRIPLGRCWRESSRNGISSSCFRR